jgi:hypothetical protein
MCEFDPCEVSHALTRPKSVVNFSTKYLYFTGIFAMEPVSRDLRFGNFGEKSAESLQPTPKKFPFLRRRLAETGSIGTAWWGWQVLRGMSRVLLNF